MRLITTCEIRLISPVILGQADRILSVCISVMLPKCSGSVFGKKYNPKQLPKWLTKL